MNEAIEMLIIDDDPHVLAVLEDLFSNDENKSVVALSDSGEALNLIPTQRFDLIITDLMMPKHDGLAVTRAAQKHSPDSLVIIITGFASLETTLEAIQLGVYDYITKPFQIDEFRLLVENASRRVLLERENLELHERLSSMEVELEQALAEQRQFKEEMESGSGKSGGAQDNAVATRSLGPNPGKLSVYERMAGDAVRRSSPRESSPAANESERAEEA